MRLMLIAIAAALAASAAPAAACGAFDCADLALADDSYPAGETALPPTVRALVEARQGQGLSLAGFYNDPSLALAERYAPAGYDYAPPPPLYVETPSVDYSYGEPRRYHGPHVIVSPYGHGRRSRIAKDVTSIRAFADQAESRESLSSPRKRGPRGRLTWAPPGFPLSRE